MQRTKDWRRHHWKRKHKKLSARFLWEAYNKAEINENEIIYHNSRYTHRNITCFLHRLKHYRRNLDRDDNYRKLFRRDREVDAIIKEQLA